MFNLLSFSYERNNFVEIRLKQIALFNQWEIIAIFSEKISFRNKSCVNGEYIFNHQNRSLKRIQVGRILNGFEILTGNTLKCSFNIFFFPLLDLLLVSFVGS